jgi:hypothetical protein
MPIFAWIDNDLVILVAWVDDPMALRPPLLVEQVQHDLEKAFTYKQEGELTKYVGSKITINRESDGLGTIEFMQLVL